MRILISLCQKFFARLGYILAPYDRRQSFSPHIRDPELYQRPTDFSRFFRPWLGPDYDKWFTPEVLSNTMLSRMHLYFLLSLVKQVAQVPGDILEAGAGSGGSARLILNCLLDANCMKRMWILDTFSGYSAIDSQHDDPSLRTHDCRCQSRSYVENLLQNDVIDVRIIEGVIPESLEKVTADQISFAHIDVNLYTPTLAATRFCLERMPQGGIILFDDYNWPSSYGARQAIDEAAAEFDQRAISIPESTQSVLIKR